MGSPPSDDLRPERDTPHEYLNFTWIQPSLALGGALPIEAAEHLARAHGIRHIVDVRLENVDDEEHLRSHGISFLHLPTQDLCAVSQEMLDHGVEWVRRHLDRGDKVFIHCQFGIGRSALLTCCVLVSTGHTPVEALRIAKTNRPCVSPSPGQLEALLLWSQRLREREGEQPLTETWDDLARVAYRGV